MISINTWKFIGKSSHQSALSCTTEIMYICFKNLTTKYIEFIFTLVPLQQQVNMVVCTLGLEKLRTNIVIKNMLILKSMLINDITFSSLTR